MPADARKTLLLGLVSIFLGSAIAFFNMFRWYQLQNSILVEPLNQTGLVLGFYAAQALSTALVLLGLYQAYMFLARGGRGSGNGAPTTVVAAIREALTLKRAMTLGAVVAVLYGVLYAFFSSFLTYQPNVDFARTYFVNGPGWTYYVCCGNVGTMPKLVVYLSPSLHLGMVLVPLSLLFLFVVPVLVGFNAILSFYALRRASAPLTGRWLAASGAAVGLFTACPTCAGLFLAGSIGGIGTTLAVALAPYQLLFIIVSIPVLLLSPLVTALSVKRSYEASCKIPAVVPSSKL